MKLELSLISPDSKLKEALARKEPLFAKEVVSKLLSILKRLPFCPRKNQAATPLL